MTLTEIGENIINFNKEGSTIDLSRTESSTKNETKVVVHRQTGKIADYIEIDYNDLEIYDKCGRGSFGTVYRGLWKSRNKIVAIKKLLQLENEAEILSTCSHRNIIQFYGIVSKDSNYCIITEYAEYGSLRDFIKQHDLYQEFGLDLILKWAHDIALGINYLHSEAPIKILHRDLKSNNVLITNGEDPTCKICDFGSSRFGIQTTKMSVIGTFPWMSPEIIQSKPANQSADVWSYGVVLWELITGEVPFKGIEEFQIAFLVVEREHRLPIPSGCPPVLSNLMQLCWQTDPGDRPSFKQILATLDQIDVDDDAKAEIDSLFTMNKAKWEQEIEQTFERLKKIEDDLHIKEKLLEAREKRLREMEMELITSGTKLLNIEGHDVNSWSEIDVYEWIKKIGTKYGRDEIGAYCDKFLNHNINGKRLMMMNKADLRNIGIASEGHIIDLYHEIHNLKIENIRLLNFPPLKTQNQIKTQTSLRNISFNLLIGAHILHAKKPEETKWKMYVDTDECEDSKDVNITSCIQDVKFSSRGHFEQHYVNRPPFVMRNWVRSVPEDTKIICTIHYDNKVIQPRKTILEYELCLNKSVVHFIQLTVEAEDNSFLKATQSTYSSSNASTATGAIALISSNIQFQALNNSTSSLLFIRQSSSGENVWKKRNLENSVIIPQETQFKNSSDLWSGVVSGKYKSNSSIIRQSSEACFDKKANNNEKYNRSQTITDPMPDKRKSCPSIGNELNNKNGQNQNGRMKRCLSGFGRGKLTLPNKKDVKAKSSYILEANLNQKPMFY